MERERERQQRRTAINGVVAQNRAGQTVLLLKIELDKRHFVNESVCSMFSIRTEIKMLKKFVLFEEICSRVFGIEFEGFEAQGESYHFECMNFAAEIRFRISGIGSLVTGRILNV